MNVEQIDGCIKTVKLRDLSCGALFTWGRSAEGALMMRIRTNNENGYVYLTAPNVGITYLGQSLSNEVIPVYQAEPLKYKLTK